MTRDRPRVLVVGGGLFQLAIIRAARALGVEIAVVDRRADAAGMAFADHALAIDTADVAAVTEAATRLQVDGVVTAASDVGVGAVASVVDALGLTGIGLEVAARGRDKLATFACLSRAGLRTPRALPVASTGEAEERVGELGSYPVVIKPRSSAGGRGVSVIDFRAQLDAAVARALVYAGSDQRVLLQEYVGGISVGAEAFFWGGALLSCFLLDDQYQEGFVSPVGHSLPCTLDAGQQFQVRKAVERYGFALGITHGAVNFDLRLTAEGPSLIEVNMRLGGNSITELIQAAHGIDLSAAAIVAALGRSPEALLVPAVATPAACRLLLKRGHGVLRFARPLPERAAEPELLRLDLTAADGEQSSMHVDEWTLLGRCITRGADPKAAAALAERVARQAADAIDIGS